MAEAVLDRNSAISSACDSCCSSTLASLGCNPIREADDSAEGIGRSLMALSRDAVVGYEVACEVTIASCSEAVKVVGTSEVAGWKRSGSAAS